MTHWYVHLSGYLLCSMKAQFAEQLTLALGLSHRTIVCPTKIRKRILVLLIQPIVVISIVMKANVLTQASVPWFFSKLLVEPCKSAFTLSSSSSDDTLATRKQLGTHDKMPFKASAPSGFRTNPASFFSSIRPFRNIVALDTFDLVEMPRCPACVAKPISPPTPNASLFFFS